MVMMLLAIRDSQIVGALLTAGYDVAEAVWPLGWAELEATGKPFDVIEADLPMGMAVSMMKKHNPHIR